MFPLKLMASCPQIYQLNVHEVPLQFQEFGIRTGYRKPYCSLYQCIMSVFWPTNETLNFWTHFLPFWYFFSKFCECYDDDAFVSDSYHWPFLAYLATVCGWPIVSCFAHLFSVLSEEMRHICFFFDYLSLSWYSFGAAMVYHAYAFDEVFFGTWFSRNYLYAAVTSAFLCIFMACQSRFIKSPNLRKFIRILSFALPFLTESVPLTERLLRRCISRAYHIGELMGDEVAIDYHCRQFLWAAAGMLFYGFHIPEVFYPGKFDIVGHSHQILHICGIMATYNQLWGCYYDMIHRRQLLRDANAVVSGGTDLTIVIIVLVIDLIVVAAFTLKVLLKPGFKVKTH